MRKIRERVNTYALPMFALVVASNDESLWVTSHFQNPESPKSEVSKKVVWVSDFTTSYSSKDKVGSKMAGLICLPNGSVKWNEVKLDDDEAFRMVISSSLNKSGLNSLAIEEPMIRASNLIPTAALSANLTHLSYKVCALEWGLGNQFSYKGRIQVKIDWKYQALQETKPPEMFQTVVNLEYNRETATTLTDMLSSALAASSMKVREKLEQH